MLKDVRACLRAAKWAAAHSDRVHKNHRKWYAANRARKKKTVREWRARNLERVRELAANSYKRNRQRVIARARRWKAKHPEHNSRYRARIHKACGFHTLEEWRILLAVTGFMCFYCGYSLTEKTATQDHIIPLTRGGTNYIENIAPACLSCNSKKGVSIRQFFWQEGIL